MAQARPKPWETNINTTTTSIPLSTTVGNSTTNNSTETPTIPPIPASVSNQSSSTPLNSYTSSNMNSYNNNSTYGSYGSYGNSYGSSYGLGGLGGMNRYGMGSMGGMGSYGSYGMNSYGGYGMGGINGMGGLNGMNGVNSPLNGVADATTRTFQVLENVVYAVSSIAALLESTYYATHNSFFTILGVADQLSHFGGMSTAIKDSIVGVGNNFKQIKDSATGNNGNGNNGPLGLYAVLAWLKRILRKLLGLSNGINDSNPNGSTSLLQDFSNWKNGIQSGSNITSKTNTNSQKSKSNRLSLKPLIVFLVTLIGLPVLMSKFVRYIEQQQIQQQVNSQSNANITTSNTNSSTIDPRSLEFARATYDYIPEREDEQPNGWKELKVTRGDLVAILNKIDGWSHCRSRDGRIGYIPTNYLEIIKRAESSKKSDVISDKPSTKTIADSSSSKNI